MTLKLITAALALFVVATVPACGSGDAAADNSFAKRKASIDAYMAAIEGAGDIDKALVAGQAWMDANLEDYKANCKVLVADSADPKKSADGEKFETPHGKYMTRVGNVGGIDPASGDQEALEKLGELRKQIKSFWDCEKLVEAK